MEIHFSSLPPALCRSFIVESPDRLVAPAAWEAHIPFAFWLADVSRPKVFVELGVHSGNSYCAFLQAIKKLQLPTQCYGIDSWRGDEHAGFYGNEVFIELSKYHDERYSQFSSLIRQTFDHSLNYFGESTIDLLHIDGLHTYDAVKHDFEAWGPKLSDGAIVLLHDINVRRNEFGVWKLWNELAAAHPHFRFDHGNGLGVLGVGKRFTKDAEWLFNLSEVPDEAVLVRAVFTSLGSGISARLSSSAARTGNRRLDSQDLDLQSHTREHLHLKERLYQRIMENNALQSQLSDLVAREAALRAQLSTQTAVALKLPVKRVGAASASIQAGPKLGSSSPNGSLRRSASRIGRRLKAVVHRLGLAKSDDLAAAETAIAASGIFLADWYLERYPDVAAQRQDPIAHYVRYGAAEGRDPNPLFDSDWYLAHYADVMVARENPLLHYLRHGAAEGRDPNPYFNSKWYIAQKGANERPNPTYPVSNDQPLRKSGEASASGFDRHSEIHADPADLENPLIHFIRHGLLNLIPPNSSIVPLRLEAMRQRLRLDSSYLPRPLDLAPLNTFPLPSTLEHFLRATYGERAIAQVRTQYYFLEFHEGLEVKIASLGFHVEIDQIIKEITVLANQGGPVGSPAPDATVIIPVFGQLVYTLSCIRALLTSPTRCSFEVIIADDASNDATVHVLQGIGGIVRLHRSDANRGFLRTCNAAAMEARGKVLVFLNNDTLPLPGWLDELVEGLRADPKCGLIGSKLINKDGTLQEAGGIVWDDASAWNFGRGGNPADPTFNYVKDVDYISGAAIALPEKLWRQLGGFDEAYTPAYYEDVDLAFRVRAVGLRTVYQPFSNVIHFEGGSHGRDVSRGVKAHQQLNKDTFYEQWKDTLAVDHYSHTSFDVRARDRSRKRPRILVVDHYVPESDRDSGSRAMFDYLKLFVSAGFHVTFWPHDLRFDSRYTPPLQRLGIEVIYFLDPVVPRFDQWLASNHHILDYAILCRPYVAREFIDLLRAHSAAKIIFFGVDIHFQRHEREFRAIASPLAEYDMVQSERVERGVWSKSDVVCYYSKEESDFVALEYPGKAARAIPIFFFDRARLLGTRERVLKYGIPRGKQVIFVAGFRHPPNVDAALWFAAKIWPNVLTAIPDARLCVVGSFPPPEVCGLASPSILVTGYVSDEVLGLLYSSSSACTVPLRYGAGVKGKVLEAISFGAPVVTTPTGIQGIPNAAEFLDVCEDAEQISATLIDILLDPGSRVAKILKGLNYLDLHVSESVARKVMSIDVPEIVV
jgi:GT2 family glycosyltransferase